MSFRKNHRAWLSNINLVPEYDGPSIEIALIQYKHYCKLLMQAFTLVLLKIKKKAVLQLITQTFSLAVLLLLLFFSLCLFAFFFNPL